MVAGCPRGMPQTYGHPVILKTGGEHGWGHTTRAAGLDERPVSGLPAHSARPQPYPDASNFLTGATQERETPHPPTTRARRDTHWLATEPSLGNLGAHAEPHQRPRKDVITRPHRWRAIDSPRSWGASTSIPLPIPHPPRVQRANPTPVTGDRTGRAVTTPVARGIPTIRPGRLKPRS